jgi:proteasome accessory factor C
MWYLSAHCLTRAEQRLFRLDRIAHLELTDEHFPESTEPSIRRMPWSSDAKATVTVRFSLALAPYMREQFGEAVRDSDNGEVEVTVPGDSEKWLTSWVLSFGGDARVVAPEWAVQAVASAARAVLEQSGASAPG